MSASAYEMSAAQRKALNADIRRAQKAIKTNPSQFSPQQRRELDAFIEHGKKGRDIRKEGGFGA